MRLPDIYYTDRKIDGTPEQHGTPEAPSYSQGEDIVFNIYLQYNGVDITHDDWDIEFIVKSKPENKRVLWTGILHNGVYENDVSSYYKVIIPSELTTILLDGTYFMDCRISQRVGDGEIKSLNIKLFTQPFIVYTSPSSPNPQLSRGSVERSGDEPVNITRK